MSDLSFIKDVVESDYMPFAQTIGLKVAELAATRVRLALPDKKSNHNHVGFSHAGAQYTLAEMTSGAMCYAALPDLADSFLLLMAKGTISYQARADGAITSLAEMSEEINLQVRRELEEKGKVKVPQKVLLFDEENKQVAKCEFLVYLKMQK